MTREEAERWLISLKSEYESEVWQKWAFEALDMAIAALRSPTPDPITGLVPCGCGHWAECSRANVKHADNPHDQDLYKPKPYCSNCGRKLTFALPELANESEKVNHEPKLASETAEICTLRCDYCGKYAKESDLTTEYTKDKYLICRRCKENA